MEISRLLSSDQGTSNPLLTRDASMAINRKNYSPALSAKNLNEAANIENGTVAIGTETNQDMALPYQETYSPGPASTQHADNNFPEAFHHQEQAYFDWVQNLQCYSFQQQYDYAQLLDAYNSLQAHMNYMQEVMTATQLQNGCLSMRIQEVETEKNALTLDLNRIRDLWTGLAENGDSEVGSKA